MKEFQPDIRTIIAESAMKPSSLETFPLESPNRKMIFNFLSVVGNIGKPAKEEQKGDEEEIWDVTDYTAANPKLSLGISAKQETGLLEEFTLYIIVEYTATDDTRNTINIPVGKKFKRKDETSWRIRISNGPFGIDKGHFKVYPDVENELLEKFSEITN